MTITDLTNPHTSCKPSSKLRLGEASSELLNYYETLNGSFERMLKNTGLGLVNSLHY